MKIQLTQAALSQYDRLKDMPLGTYHERMDAIEGKLAAEGHSIDSSWDDIVPCLEACSAPTYCVAMAAIAVTRANPGKVEIEIISISTEAKR